MKSLEVCQKQSLVQHDGLYVFDTLSYYDLGDAYCIRYIP